MWSEYLPSAQREYIMDFIKPKSDTRCIVYYKGTQSKYENALQVYESQHYMAVKTCQHACRVMC